jgi:glycosyltransferase involved in cell wall biosynthesis
MRIAFVSADATPLVRGDGTEPDDHGRRLAALASELAAAGHTVDVFTRRNDLWSAPVIALAPNANVVQLPAGPPHFLPATQLSPLMEDFAARLVGACGSGDGYDVLHASLHLSGLAALRLRERRGVPFVISLDDHEASAAEQRVAAAAARVIAFDPGERERLIARYGDRSAPIEVIPAGVDTAAFAPASSAAARVQLDLRPEEFVVVQRARLERNAGIDAGIRAIAALRREHDVAARLLVAVDTHGFDPYTSAEIGRLRAIAAAAGVAGQLTFGRGGSPAALRHAYAAADAALVLQAEARVSASPLEAMACGIPVVGADVSGLRWAVQSEVTGFLVPPGDSAAVAERLARIRRNPELGRAYGRAGIRRVRAGFTWRHAAAALARIYATVLAPLHSRLATAASR